MDISTHRLSPRPLLGVLGGMGPLATADFLRKLAQSTPARCDQEHVPLVAASMPHIPDRVAAILSGGPSPLPALLDALSMLEQCGATRIAIPCNTAHFWFDSLQSRTAVPILHIADAVISQLRAMRRENGYIGVLATTATIKANIYGARLEAGGFRYLTPADDDQQTVMAVVRALKAGECNEAVALRLRSVALRLAERGAEAIVLACTELPLLLPFLTDLALVDATEALAEECLRRLDWQQRSA